MYKTRVCVFTRARAWHFCSCKYKWYTYENLSSFQNLLPASSPNLLNLHSALFITLILSRPLYSSLFETVTRLFNIVNITSVGWFSNYRQCHAQLLPFIELRQSCFLWRLIYNDIDTGMLSIFYMQAFHLNWISKQSPFYYNFIIGNRSYIVFCLFCFCTTKLV